MDDTQLHYAVDQAGNLTSVLVPIEQWRKVKAQLEAAYLAGGETMEKHLLAVIRQPEPRHPFTGQLGQAGSR